MCYNGLMPDLGQGQERILANIYVDLAFFEPLFIRKK